MTNVFSYWTETRKGVERNGYSVAEITFHFEALLDEEGRADENFGKDRKTLSAAINDAQKFFKKHHEDNYYYGIYAEAEITDYYEDGTAIRVERDGARIGTLSEDGSYFDLCEPVDWL